MTNAHALQPEPLSEAETVPTPSLGPREIPVWVVSAHVESCTAEERAGFAERAAATLHGDDASGRLLFVTCHRAELYGSGAAPGPLELARLAGGADVARRLRVVAGDTATRHAFRLAAGLESAIVGEDQILHQLRELRESARERTDLDPHLPRLLELATGVGRRARAGRGRERADEPHDLAGRALEWLALRLPEPTAAPAPLLVAGAGTMGRLLAAEARRHGFAVTVASRRIERAEAAAEPVGAEALRLADAAALARAGRFAAVAVALSGPWPGLDDDAPAEAVLPPIADLSSPRAVPRGVAVAQLDIDELYDWRPPAPAAPVDGSDADAEYVLAATRLVAEAVERYRRWSAGRASVETLRALRERADARRAEELARLLRRLPDLEPRQRSLVEAFSEQLVATILHAPSARLREDADGSAAAAVRRLFDL